jgi:hypothetical protein
MYSGLSFSAKRKEKGWVGMRAQLKVLRRGGKKGAEKRRTKRKSRMVLLLVNSI